MERTTWDDYIRTGVVHVLVISGQHLMVLAGFLWLVCFALGISQRRAVILIAGVVMVYALMTGFRPSAVRATIMVLATCGAILQRRPVHRANSLCLAWLVVLVMNPIDLFDLGCRLSFLSVLVLIFGATTWFAKAERSPLDRLIDENRSVLERSARSMARFIAVAYAVNALLFLTTAPLLMAEQHVVAPVTLLLGPIIVFTSSIALVCGFLFLFFGIVPLLNEVLAWLLKLALEGNAAAVHAATRIPGGTVYVASVPSWWLVGYYLIGGAILWRGWSQSRALRWCWLGWVFLGLAWPGGSKPSDELRVTFLAVGHGSCVLLEPTDGRCVLYDAGSLSGPDVVRNSIAPFLWQRGHRRIDEVFVSHADADHFNGLVELSKRFAIGQVSFTPSFATRPTQDVADTLEVLRNLGIGTRTVAAGDRFALADTSLSVLHPPLEGPMGTENERSLVLQIEQYGYTLLLLGDLEKAGTAMLTAQPPLVVDLAQAPHHGSQTAFTPALRQWLKTRGVIVNRGDLFRNAVTQAHTGRPTWDTQTHGAITLRFTPAGLILETYRTGQRELFQR
jgi:competence protein ComEC